MNTSAMILFTLGAIIAILRKSIGEVWLRIHLVCQLCATLILLLSITLVIYTSKNKNKADPKTPVGRHKIIGKILLSIILFQVVFAFIGKRIFEKSTWYIIQV
jgi:NADH:ubiquinone oxidoreductase subunit 6 (subunit J)